jgi:hypothetical protein
MPSLIATLGANISPFLDELNSASGHAAKHGDSIGSALGEHIKSALGKLSAMGVIEETIRHSLENAERLSNLSVRTGLPVGELQGLQNIAAKTGTTLEGLVGLYEKLGKTMAKAHADSGSDEAGALKRLGVSAASLDTGDMRAAFAEMADHLQRSGEITPQLESDLSKIYKNAREAIPALKAMTLEERLFQESLETGPQRMGAMKLLTDKMKDGWAIMKGMAIDMTGQVVLGTQKLLSMWGHVFLWFEKGLHLKDIVGAKKLIGLGDEVKKATAELKGSKTPAGEAYAEESKKQLEAKKKAEEAALRKREQEEKEIARLHEMTEQEQKRGRLAELTNAAKAKQLEQEVKMLENRIAADRFANRGLDQAKDELDLAKARNALDDAERAAESDRLRADLKADHADRQKPAQHMVNSLQAIGGFLGAYQLAPEVAMLDVARKSEEHLRHLKAIRKAVEGLGGSPASELF